MANKGYIYFWRNSDAAGKIRICSGNFSNLNVGFSISDCSKGLQTKLKGNNLNQTRTCPPPVGSLCVTCDFGVSTSGDFIATNISETVC